MIIMRDRNSIEPSASSSSARRRTTASRMRKRMIMLRRRLYVALLIVVMLPSAAVMAASWSAAATNGDRQSIKLALVSNNAEGAPPPMQQQQQRRRRDAKNYVSTLAPWQNAYTEFNAIVQAGTPPQNFSLLLDTGSTLMFIISKNCDAQTWSICGSLSNQYDISASSTGTYLGRPAPSISYQDGTAINGPLVKDTIFFGPSISIPEFPFMAADSVDEKAPSQSTQGTIGMSPDRTTLMHALLRENVLHLPVASFYIDETDLAGEVTIGDIDVAQFSNSSDDIMWLPVIDRAKNADWTVQIRGVYHSAPTPSGSNFSFPGGAFGATIDTGTSNCLIPSSIFQVVVDALNAVNQGSDFYTAPCSNAAQGLTIFFDFGYSVVLSMTPTEYFVKLTPDDANCTVWLTPVNWGPNQQSTALLGNSLLKRYVTTFDYDQQRVGFALAKGRNYVDVPPASLPIIPIVRPKPANSAPPSSASSLRAFFTLSLVLTIVVSLSLW